MEGAGCDEQNMVGFDRSVFGRDRGAFDERKEIALHALARDIAAKTPFTRANLVDLIEKHNPIVFDLAKRLLNDLILIDHLVAFFDNERSLRVPYRHAARLCAPAK